MPMKREFVGYYKVSGERVVKVYNPVGIMVSYFVENGEGPYAGIQVFPRDIIKELPKEDKEEKTSELDEMFKGLF